MQNFTSALSFVSLTISFCQGDPRVKLFDPGNFSTRKYTAIFQYLERMSKSDFISERKVQSCFPPYFRKLNIVAIKPLEFSLPPPFPSSGQWSFSNYIGCFRVQPTSDSHTMRYATFGGRELKAQMITLAFQTIFKAR